MNKPIAVTTKQNEYLIQLTSGPKTTRDFVLSMMVSNHSAGKMIKRLRDAGLVKSSKLRGAHGNVHLHELTAPYSELNIIVNNHTNTTRLAITDAEIHYVAKLRNAGLVGQRLIEAHRRKYPKRPTSSIIKVLVERAKAERLCR